MSTIMQQQVSCNATSNIVTFFATLSDKQLQRKELGAWIKFYREEANLSQESAAEKTGMSRYQWIRLENGQSGTRRDTLIRIAEVLKADINLTLQKGGFSNLFESDKSNAAKTDKSKGPDVPDLVGNVPMKAVLLPDELDVMDFDGLDKNDLKEIGDFIRFKKAQKKFQSNPVEDNEAPIKNSQKFQRFQLPDKRKDKSKE